MFMVRGDQPIRLWGLIDALMLPGESIEGLADE